MTSISQCLEQKKQKNTNPKLTLESKQSNRSNLLKFRQILVPAKSPSPLVDINQVSTVNEITTYEEFHEIPDKRKSHTQSSDEENQEPLSKKQSKEPTLKLVLKNLNKCEIDELLKVDSKEESEIEGMNVSSELDSGVDSKSDTHKGHAVLDENSSENSDDECSLKGKSKPEVKKSSRDSKMSNSSDDFKLKKTQKSKKMSCNDSDEDIALKNVSKQKCGKGQVVSSDDDENEENKSTKNKRKRKVLTKEIKKRKLASDSDSDEMDEFEGNHKKKSRVSSDPSKKSKQQSKLQENKKPRKKVAPKSTKDVLSTSSDSLAEESTKSQGRKTSHPKSKMSSDSSSDDSDDQPLNIMKSKTKSNSQVKSNVNDSLSDSSPTKPKEKSTEKPNKILHNFSHKRSDNDELKSRSSDSSSSDSSKSDNSDVSSDEDCSKSLKSRSLKSDAVLKSESLSESSPIKPQKKKMDANLSGSSSDEFDNKPLKTKTLEAEVKLESLSGKSGKPPIETSSSDESDKLVRKKSPLSENQDKVKDSDSSLTDDEPDKPAKSISDSDAPLVDLKKNEKKHVIKSKAKDSGTKRRSSISSISSSSSDEKATKSKGLSKSNINTQSSKGKKSKVIKKSNSKKETDIPSKSKPNDSDDSSDSSLPSENENSKERKRKSPKENKSSKKKRDPLLRYKKYLRTMGVYAQYGKLLEGCRSINAKKEKLIKLMEENGLKGKPTMEKCKKVRKKNETKKEIAELDLGNIISDSGRGRRNVDSLYSRTSSAVNLCSPTKKSRIKRPISDSDSE